MECDIDSGVQLGREAMIGPFRAHYTPTEAKRGDLAQAIGQMSYRDTAFPKAGICYCAILGFDGPAMHDDATMKNGDSASGGRPKPQGKRRPAARGYAPITDGEEANHAFQQLVAGFRQGAESFPNCRLGFWGAGRRIEAHWHGQLRFWGAFERNADARRFRNAFGQDGPGINSQLEATVEINAPLSGVNRRLGGLFVTDGVQRFFAHSGRVGGGRQGIGQYAFKAFTGPEPWRPVAWPSGAYTEVMLVTAVDAPDLVKRIHRHLRRVQQFKAQAQPPPYFPEVRENPRRYALRPFYVSLPASPAAPWAQCAARWRR